MLTIEAILLGCGLFGTGYFVGLALRGALPQRLRMVAWITALCGVVSILLHSIYVLRSLR